MYKRTMEALKTRERKITIELPLTSIDSKYSLEGCYNYVTDKLEDKGYRIKFKVPNYLVVYTQKTPVSSIPYSAPATLESKSTNNLSDKTKATAQPLKKNQVTAKVKRQTEKLKQIFPNIDTIEYYRV